MLINNKRNSLHQQNIQKYIQNSDTLSFFNPLMSSELSAVIETETLSLFLTQTLNEDRSCQKGDVVLGDAFYGTRAHSYRCNS